MKEELQRWKKEAFSIPKCLSYLRLILIPIFCVLYARGEYLTTAILVVLSGFTDALDGYIARHCNMITELGKIVDPVADKLTQLALALCLVSRYRWLLWVFALLVIKEGFMAAMGLLVLKRKYEIHGAIWCGKVSTMTFYCVMLALLFFPYMPENLARLLGLLCVIMLCVSFAGYAVFYSKMIREHEHKGDLSHGSEN